MTISVNALAWSVHWWQKITEWCSRLHGKTVIFDIPIFQRCWWVIRCNYRAIYIEGLMSRSQKLTKYRWRSDCRPGCSWNSSRSIWHSSSWPSPSRRCPCTCPCRHRGRSLQPRPHTALLENNKGSTTTKVCAVDTYISPQLISRIYDFLKNWYKGLVLW